VVRRVEEVLCVKVTQRTRAQPVSRQSSLRGQSQPIQTASAWRRSAALCPALLEIETLMTLDKGLTTTVGCDVAAAATAPALRGVSHRRSRHLPVRASTLPAESRGYQVTGVLKREWHCRAAAGGIPKYGRVMKPIVLNRDGAVQHECS
jgi:hypothetical protein